VPSLCFQSPLRSPSHPAHSSVRSVAHTWHRHSGVRLPLPALLVAHVRNAPCAAQVPRFITIGDSRLVHRLPMEVAAWWATRSGLVASGWMLVVSTSALLAGHLVQRGPIGVNLTWLVPGVPAEAPQEVLNPLGDALKREVKVADGLAPVAWAQTAVSGLEVGGGHSGDGVYPGGWRTHGFRPLWCVHSYPPPEPFWPGTGVVVRGHCTGALQAGGMKVYSDIEKQRPLDVSGRVLPAAEDVEAGSDGGSPPAAPQEDTPKDDDDDDDEAAKKKAGKKRKDKERVTAPAKKRGHDDDDQSPSATPFPHPSAPSLGGSCVSGGLQYRLGVGYSVVSHVRNIRLVKVLGLGGVLPPPPQSFGCRRCRKGAAPAPPPKGGGAPGGKRGGGGRKASALENLRGALGAK
jgi:hypothetical protein